MRYLWAFFGLVLAVMLAGCMNSGEPGTSPEAASYSRISASETSATQSASAQPAQALASLQQTAGTPMSLPGHQDYRLGALDVIEVSVFQVPDLTKTVQINAGGLISLPLIGTVQAGGKTISELESEIEQRLGERYLQSPQVSVFVSEYTSQRVTVEGAVREPGVFQIAGQSSLLQVVAMAKGLDRTADPSGVMIFRNQNGTRTGAVFDLNSIRSGETSDPVVTGGDVVVVDQSAARTAWRDIRESIGVLSVFRPVLF